MAVNLIGLALLARHATHGSWWFDTLLAIATAQLASVLIPMIKKPKRITEHLCRMFAALLAIAIAGAYIVTSASGLAAWILALNFIFFDTVLAYRLAAMTMQQNGKSPDIAKLPHDPGRDSGRVGSTHSILPANPKLVSSDAGETTLRPQRAVAG